MKYKKVTSLDSVLRISVIIKTQYKPFCLSGVIGVQPENGKITLFYEDNISLWSIVF